MIRDGRLGAAAFGAALASLAALGGLSGCDSRAPRGVLVVTIDTCRADRLGCYGAARPTTAAMDALAARGTVFEQASAPAPLTLPSHCTLLTGLYPDRHTVRDNGAARLPESADTLPEILRDAGWSTAAFVAAFPVESKFGLDQGFDTYGDDFSGPAAGTGFSERTNDVASRLFYDERTASEVVDEALPWLEAAARGPDPFFAWVHLFDPHASYRAPARFARQYGADSYEAEVAFVDEQIARLLESLEGLEDRVTVLVTADHGESLGEHEEATHGLFIYESSLRVPWILAGPDVPRGLRVPDPVSTVDVMPTLLDLLGFPVAESLDGESLVGRLQGTRDVAPTVHAECLYSRLHYGWAPLRSVRRGDWKLIEAPTPELYNLRNDPHETENVAASHPDLVRDLTAELEVHAVRGGALPAEELDIDDATIERLERLGYVGSVGAEERSSLEDLWDGRGRDPKEMVGFFNRLQEIPTLMLAGNYDEATRQLHELRAIDAGNRNVLAKLALLKRIEEKWDEASEWCLRILEIDPADVETRMNYANARLQVGDREGARSAYRDVVARTPRHESAWGLLASLYSEDGFHEEAQLAFETAVANDPEDAELHASFAAALERAGDVIGSAARFDRALELDPHLSAAVNGKALLLSHTDRAGEAVRVLRGALPALEDDLDTLNNLAWILTNESIDPAQGWEFAQRARGLAPEDPAVLDTYGWAAIRSGNAHAGVEALRTAWLATSDAEVRAHLGIALAMSGREPEGRGHVRAAVEERPSLLEVPEVAEWSGP